MPNDNNEPIITKIKNLKEEIDTCNDMINCLRERNQDSSSVISAQNMLNGRLAFISGEFNNSKKCYEDSISGLQDLNLFEEMSVVALEAAKEFWDIKDIEAAKQFSEDAVNGIKYSWMITSLPNKLSLPETAIRVYDFSIGLCYSIKEYDQVFEYVQRVKAHWLLDIMALQHLGKSVPFRRLLVGRKLDDLLINDKSEFTELSSELDSRWKNYLSGHLLEKELENIEERVLESYSKYSRHFDGPIVAMASIPTIKDIQRRLDINEGILEYFVQKDGVYIIVIKNNDYEIEFKSIDPNILKERIPFIYINLIQAESRRQAENRAKETKDIDKSETINDWKNSYPSPVEGLKWLYDILIEPVEDNIRNVNRLIICPHWLLNIVPFAALLSAKDNKYVVESKSITYSPNASIWAKMMDIKKEKASSKETIALVVGVEQMHVSKWWDSVGNFIGKLIGNENISDFEGEAASIAKDLNAIPLIGPSAQKDAILNRFQSSDIIHFSCHTVERAKPLVNGLLLADGVLTLAEILINEKIGGSSPSIITLSACRSGINRVEPGDNIWGIGYGFLARCGCPILSSLWPVDAEATRFIMERFYRYGIINSDWSDALKKAQNELMVSFSRLDKKGRSISFKDPYYWSGFFLLGP